MKKSIGAKDYCDFILKKIEDAAGVIISGSVDLIDYLEASLNDDIHKSGEEAVFRLSGIHTALFSPFSAIELSIRRIDELFEIVEKTAILESIQDESRVLLDKFGYETYKKYDALLQDALDLCKYFNEGIDTSDQEVYNKNIASYLVNIKSLLLDIKKKYQNL